MSCTSQTASCMSRLGMSMLCSWCNLFFSMTYIRYPHYTKHALPGVYRRNPHYSHRLNVMKYTLICSLKFMFSFHQASCTEQNMKSKLHPWLKYNFEGLIFYHTRADFHSNCLKECKILYCPQYVGQIANS